MSLVYILGDLLNGKNRLKSPMIREMTSSLLRGVFSEMLHGLASHVGMLLETKHVVRKWPLRDWLVLIIGFVPLLFSVVIIRLVRPFLLIRFGILMSNRIGHFSGNTELYLCERDANAQSGKMVDVFCYQMPICNQQLQKMWERKLNICTLARSLKRVNRLLPGYVVHEVPWSSDVDRKGLRARSKIQVAFTPDEKRRGRAELGKLGIPENSPFICFHARDSSYLKTIPIYSGMDLRYHDYRDSSIGNYLPAAEELVRRGYYAIRMGAEVGQCLKSSNPKIVDYATKYRSEFMDIFLSAGCRFFLCDTGGICGVAKIFHRPVAYANLVPIGLENIWTLAPGSLFIPKKLRWARTGSLLRFREILESGAGDFFRSEQYEQLGIEVLENTPEEITALAVEMHERLNGTWQITEEDDELQCRFWEIFRRSLRPSASQPLHGEIRSRIGAQFLRQNKAWLE